MKIYNFRGDLSDVTNILLEQLSDFHLVSPKLVQLKSLSRATWKKQYSQLRLFPKLNEIFFGEFDPANIFCDIKKKLFLG